ncbi:MAG TPA: AarF/UbiB family protein, partial [Polyangiaceae bacterium]|nr:AarF/UbiB family protein [Polyangiaceae bacterium]
MKETYERMVSDTAARDKPAQPLAPAAGLAPRARAPYGGGTASPAPPPASGGWWRFVRAYATTFVVIASYVSLGLRARVLGRSWRDANVAAVHQKNARRVYATIVRLQGLFIKVGQLLSIMANFLPDEFRAELEALQDKVPERPYAEIAERLESELGNLMAMVASLDREPVASASLGQVHAATLVDGRRVCVKVQHRAIDRIVVMDLATIRRIMTIV